MSFLVLPPEINSAQIFGGAGIEPMYGAAQAWGNLAAELGSAATSFGGVTSTLTSASYQGAASQAMMEAAAPYVGWLTTVSAQADQTAAAARTMVAAFEKLQAATVHPDLIALNRVVVSSLARTNLFGLNFPAIAAVEADYAEMWAQDIAAMLGYYADA